MQEKAPLLGIEKFRKTLHSNDFKVYDHHTEVLSQWKNLSTDEQIAILIEEQSSAKSSPLLEELCGNAHESTLISLVQLSTEELLQKIPENNRKGTAADPRKKSNFSKEQTNLIKLQLLEHTANHLSKNKISKTDYRIKQGLSVLLVGAFIATCVLFPPAGPVGIISYAIIGCLATKVTELIANGIQSQLNAKSNPVRAQAYRERCKDNIKEMAFMTLGGIAAAVGIMASPALAVTFATLIVSSVLGTMMNFGANQFKKTFLNNPEKHRPIAQGIYQAMITIGTFMENPFHIIGKAFANTKISQTIGAAKNTLLGQTNITKEARRVLIDELSGPLRPLVGLRNYAGEAVEFQKMEALQRQLHTCCKEVGCDRPTLNRMRRALNEGTQVQKYSIKNKENRILNRMVQQKSQAIAASANSLTKMKDAINDINPKKNQSPVEKQELNLEQVEVKKSQQASSEMIHHVQSFKNDFIGPPEGPKVHRL